MEKINIAELLKDCPKGMELDCTMFDNATLHHVDMDKPYPIFIEMGGGELERFTEYGQWHSRDYAKCVIFPKGKTSWEGFQRPFEDGDIVIYKDKIKLVAMILNKFVNFVEVHYHCALYDNAIGFVTNNYIVGELKYTRLATEEEKEKLFKAIKDNGYKWNAETKTLEKLVEPMFKVGDRIQWYGDCINHPIRVVKNIEFDRYRLDNGSYIKFSDEHAYKLLKFDINTLIPFESRVLVRHSMDAIWKPAVFGFRNGYNNNAFYIVGGSCWNQCIPYLNNEHLCGTTNDCDEFYKTWEE